MLSRTRLVLGVVILGFGATVMSGQTIVRCESKGSRRECRVANIREVAMRRQLSMAACIENESWGYSDDSIWVDRGCRADFDVIVRHRDRDRDRDERRGGDRGQGSVLICESDGGRRLCPADTRFGVELTRTTSRRRCVEGRNWGSNDRGVWVDDGCGGEFLVGRSRGEDRVESDRRPTLLVCESDYNGRKDCAADARFGVELKRQISRTECVFNRTWGYDRRGVWVSNGCRAEFLIRSR
jgi:hypothetical protein